MLMIVLSAASEVSDKVLLLELGADDLCDQAVQS
jgi:DNA-binding response OmpR family regulator